MIPLPAKEESILLEQAKLGVHQNDWAAGFLDVTGPDFPAHAVHCLGVTRYVPLAQRASPSQGCLWLRYVS